MSKFCYRLLKLVSSFRVLFSRPIHLLQSLNGLSVLLPLLFITGFFHSGHIFAHIVTSLSQALNPELKHVNKKHHLI